MRSETLYRVSGLAVIVGAAVGSAMTALELVTAPYNPYGAVLWLNPWIHLAKYIGMIVLIMGLPGVYVRQRERAGRLGFISIVMLCLGLAFAGTPYNVVEWSVDPTLSQQEAVAALDEIYGATPIWELLGMPGLLAFLIGTVLFGIATLRAKILPRWTAVLSLASIAVGIASMFIESALPGLVPHPPTWLLLGLTGYGYVLARGTSVATTSVASPLAHDLGGGGTTVGS